MEVADADSPDFALYQQIADRVGGELITILGDHDASKPFLAFIATNKVDTRDRKAFTQGSLLGPSKALSILAIKVPRDAKSVDDVPEGAVHLSSGLEAMAKYASEVTGPAADAFKATMIYSDSRYLLSAFPNMNDATTFVPLVNATAGPASDMTDEQWADALAFGVCTHAFLRVHRMMKARPHVMPDAQSMIRFVDLMAANMSPNGG